MAVLSRKLTVFTYAAVFLPRFLTLYGEKSPSIALKSRMETFNQIKAIVKAYTLVKELKNASVPSNVPEHLHLTVPPLRPILHQMNPVHMLTPYSFKIDFNVFPSMPRSP
jgi:hypothetical protein